MVLQGEQRSAAARDQAELAIKAAVDAAAAEKRSADAAERAAAALEHQNQIAADQAAQAEGVPWELRHHRWDTYELFNASVRPKFGVKLSAGRSSVGSSRTASTATAA